VWRKEVGIKETLAVTEKFYFVCCGVEKVRIKPDEFAAAVTARCTHRRNMNVFEKER
jgi:hypothetical protein